MLNRQWHEFPLPTCRNGTEKRLAAVPVPYLSGIEGTLSVQYRLAVSILYSGLDWTGWCGCGCRLGIDCYLTRLGAMHTKAPTNDTGQPSCACYCSDSRTWGEEGVE